ncbi:class D sortase [Salinisphaera aquimarina]|uniref:Class D sortase n=1 Tax=Salinisphaera aquimarina TaxID=2094031 RepID=A0ABV7EUJ2_9GAMM
MAAHRDTRFRFLEELAVGDMLALEDLDGTVRRYRVTDTQIVRWDRFTTPRAPGARTLALATCYPFDAVTPGPLRYVVHARAVDRVATTRTATNDPRAGQ